jgi:SAM-dependent methyltransferase
MSRLLDLVHRQRSRRGRPREDAHVPEPLAVAVDEPPTVAPPEPPPVERLVEAESTAVDSYWTGHLVNSRRFDSAEDSERYLQWRFDEYPLYRELAGLYGDHAGETVLDYGCGPGDDLTGYALHSGAERLIGLDVSATALDLAAHRLALHGIEPARVRLGQVRDGVAAIPLDDDSVDHVHCAGVLHHTSAPETLLAEIHRVLKPGGRGMVMVYNTDSVWLHLYVAYEKLVLEPEFAGVDLDTAFTRLTDGEACPISRHYSAPDMVALCEAVGLRARYVGGYLSRHELERLDASWAPAIADERLADRHRDFLRALTFDHGGRPMIDGYHAGIGGLYHLRKEGAR